jgi:hypothetical protein
MSGHRRVCVALLVFAGLSVSPASSNALTDWLSNPAGQEAAGPAQAECVAHPDTSTQPGRHWMYHQDGHRKCWFEAQLTAPVRKHVPHHAAKRFEKEAAGRKMAVLNARDELLTDATARVQQARIPGFTDTAPAPSSETATRVSAEPVQLQRTTDRLATDDTNPRSGDMLAEVGSIDKVRAPSSPPQAIASVLPAMSADKDSWQPMAPRLGIVAIALGLALVVGSMLSSELLSSSGANRRAEGLLSATRRGSI